jgi:hypothetical protein
LSRGVGSQHHPHRAVVGTSNESNSIWVTAGPPFGLIVLYSGDTNVLLGWELTAGITFVGDSMEAW